MTRFRGSSHWKNGKLILEFTNIARIPAVLSISDYTRLVDRKRGGIKDPDFKLRALTRKTTYNPGEVAKLELEILVPLEALSDQTYLRLALFGPGGSTVDAEFVMHLWPQGKPIA